MRGRQRAHSRLIAADATKRRRRTANSQSLSDGTLRPLLYVAAAALLLTILSSAQAVIVPLVLAAMMGFILTPPVAFLERAGIRRALSVALVVLVALGVLGGFGYTLSRQFNDFATHLPQYTAPIESKLATLRATRKGAIGQIQDTVGKVSHELNTQETANPAAARDDVQPVLVVPGDTEHLRSMLEPFIRPIATAVIVLILTIFVLAQREDLRNRLIRLAGRGRITVTTRTLDEAGQRISRFLFTQAVINAIFGVVVALGLLFIGVPYALLWGMSAGCLRFVPYLGTILGMSMPAALAFVGSDGWTPTIETLALFSVAGAFTTYAAEPLLIGARTGTSSIALLVSAMFWTWLWGPVGLLLSAPITMCLVAIGKHVPEMEFLTVLLGDTPPLGAEIVFYQRLLADDKDEAREIFDQELSKAAREIVFDRVVVPTLLRADRHRLRGEILPARRQFVLDSILEALRDGAESRQQNRLSAREGSVPPPRLLGIPSRTDSDALALEMLTQLLDETLALTQLPTGMLASDVLRAISETAPDVVCIAALPPGGLRHARYLCKQVHNRFPRVPIWVLRVGIRSNPLELTRQLMSDGAHQVVTSFADAAIQVAQLIRDTAQPPAQLASSADPLE